MMALNPRRKRLALAALTCALIAMQGCSWFRTKTAPVRRDGPVRVDMEFRGVRQLDPGVDELDRIRAAVERGGGVVAGTQRISDPRRVAGGTVRDVRLLVDVDSLSELASIDRRLIELSRERSGDTITSFTFEGVTLKYIAPYVGGRIEKTFLGEATPGATVRVHARGRSPQSVPVDRRGVYRVPIETAEGQNFIYVSIETRSPSVTRYRRIHVDTQRQQDLSRDEFFDFVERQP